MFHSTGQIAYFANPPHYKSIVVVDSELARYYRQQVPVEVKLNRPKYSAHISVVRNEIPVNLNAWAAYEGQAIEFEYEHQIYNDELYYWLNCYSPRLEEIRQELGLTSTRSPNGAHRFHCTLGNLKVPK